MTLELLDALSLPGDAAKPNEDSFAHLDHAALVLDGATPLGPSLLPGPSDAAWIAQFGARRLAAHLKDGDGPEKALRQALEDAARSFAGLSRRPIREKWQMPCASMMLVSLGRDQPPPRARSALAVGRGSRPSEPSVVAGPRASEDRRGLKFFWFGDCAAIVQSGDDVTVVGESLRKRREEAARAKKMARALNLSSAAGVNRPEIEPLLRAARNRINAGRNWLFSPDPRAAKHAARRDMAVKKGDQILLASDGFLALVGDYGLYDPKSLLEAAERDGLEALGKILRATEDADPAGEVHARFKKSDDATAVLLRVR